TGLVFSVTLLKAVDTASLFLKVHIARVKRMVFRVHFAAINAILNIHSTARFKLRPIAHYNRTFVVFLLNSFFHNRIFILPYFSSRVPNIGLYSPTRYMTFTG